MCPNFVKRNANYVRNENQGDHRIVFLPGFVIGVFLLFNLPGVSVVYVEGSE
jgi:hypothetical protein